MLQETLDDLQVRCSASKVRVFSLRAQAVVAARINGEQSIGRAAAIGDLVLVWLHLAAHSSCVGHRERDT